MVYGLGLLVSILASCTACTVGCIIFSGLIERTLMDHASMGAKLVV